MTKRPNKLPLPDDEEIAADRRKRRNRWPADDYVFGAALLLAGIITLIAIAIATGLVKP